MTGAMLPTVPGGFADMPDQTTAIIAGMGAAAIEEQIEKAVAGVKAGVYRCPWKCGNPAFAAPKWKTEAGFRGHLAKCPERPQPEDFTQAKPVVVETSDRDWDRRHAGQSWADSTEAAT